MRRAFWTSLKVGFLKCSSHRKPSEKEARKKARDERVKKTGGVTMTTKQSITSVTSGQEKQIIRFGSDATEAALKALGLDKDGAQRIIEHGDEFTSAIRNAAHSALRNLSVSDRFKDEEVKSNYGYLSDYRKPVEVSDQIDILRSHWPSLNPDVALRYYRETYLMLQLPKWVEGPFVIISPGFFSDQYGEELTEVLKAIAKDRKGKFYNYREWQFGPEYLRQSERTLGKLYQVCETQSGSDILIVPAQLGIRHRGRSVRRVREVFTAGEYGLDAKDVGTMILTNPLRLQHYDDLWIDCAGDEYAPGADGVFSRAPCFSFGDGGVEFDAYWFGDADSLCGSASGFLPQ